MNRRLMPMLAGLAAGVMIGAGAVNAIGAGTLPRIFVNGTRVNADVIMKDDRTYLPLRAVGEAMGAEVRYDEASDSVFVSYSEDNAVTKLVEQISPGVVAIVADYGGRSGSYGSGSGVIYKSNGVIITNAHVVEDAKSLTVILYDGTMLPATVLIADEEADIALVKINKIGLVTVPFAAEKPLPGQTSIAIGTPTSLSLRNTVTKGIVSGTDVTPFEGMNYYKLLQMDTTINHGNSGGALVNMRGELIGINSYGLGDYNIENTNFAIPVDTVQYVINCYETYGRVIRPSFGLTLETSWEAQRGFPTSKGLTVRKAPEGTFDVGDVICGVNGAKITNIYDVREALKKTYTPGSDVLFGYLAGGDDGEYREIRLYPQED